jgi:hypothetical protein
LGDEEKAAREEKLFRRFKAEEAAQAITARPRMLSPEDNNERQQIHEHESVVLPIVQRPPAEVAPVRQVQQHDSENPGKTGRSKHPAIAALEVP